MLIDRVGLDRRIAHRPRVPQRHVARLILQGHSSQSISTALGISVGTVKMHRHTICQRLGIASHTELFRSFINYLVKPS